MAKDRKRDIEEVPVFGIAPPTTPFPPGDQVTIILGIPTKAWRRMQNGQTATFDLRKAGIPINIIMFGAPTHKVAYDTINQHNAKHGISTLNKLDEDFSIKEGDNDGATETVQGADGDAGDPMGGDAPGADGVGSDGLRGAGGGEVRDQQHAPVPVVKQ